MSMKPAEEISLYHLITEAKNNRSLHQIKIGEKCDLYFSQPSI